MHLLYVSQLRLYVAACNDLKLRVFSNEFRLIATVPVSSTIISLAFNPNEHELYTGELGQVLAWKLRCNFFRTLVHGPPLGCELQTNEWASILNFDSRSNLLLVSTSWTVHVVDTLNRGVLNVYSTVHVSITSTAILAKLGYLFVGNKSGSIKVWSYSFDYLVHTLNGHSNAVTGIVVHPASLSIISCSQDKTIRIWNLDNMMQTHNVLCEKEVLGMCWDFPRLTCYSERSITMWSVSRLESHFAAICSNVLKMERVALDKSCQRAPRILTLAEDGGIRLLSPATGQVITIIFPMFSIALIDDAVYSLSDDLIFVLLKTNNVLVFDTRYNPCLTKEFWTPTVPYYKIGCFTICHVVLSTGKVHALVFGGQFNGDIVLIYSSNGVLKMPRACSLHRDHITNMVGSCNLIADSNTPALVTFGKLEGVLNIWVVNVKEPSCRVSLSLYLSIQMMNDCPQKILLTDATMCLALEDKQLIMLKVPDWTQGQYENKFPKLSELPVMRHQHEDNHTKSVTSLVSCSYLKIVVTSSSDGVIKAWNLENQLLSDLDIGVPLSAVGIASDSGDLLIGARNIVTYLGSEDYLPDNYATIGKACAKLDPIEKPIPFDHDLDFWYDSDRVLSLPLDQQQRAHYVNKQHVNVPKPKLNVSSVNLLVPSSTKIESTYQVNTYDTVLLQQQVDVTQAMFHSLQFSSFISTSSSSAVAVVEDLSCDVLSNPAEESVHSHVSVRHSESVKPHNLVKKLSHVFLAMEYPRGHALATLAPLLNRPSAKIIAPDGFIPNSVIRDVMKCGILDLLDKQEPSHILQDKTLKTKFLEETSKKRRLTLAEVLHGNEVIPSGKYKHPQKKKQKSKISKPRWSTKDISGAVSDRTSSLDSDSDNESKEDKSVLKQIPKRVKIAAKPFVNKSRLVSRKSKVEVSQSVVTQAAVASVGLAHVTKQVSGAAEWRGTGKLLHEAISRPWYPKEFIEEGEPTVRSVYKGIMEALKNTDSTEDDFSNMLDVLLTLKL